MNATMVLSLALLLSGCAATDGNDRTANNSAPANTPKVIAKGVSGSFDLIVGHSHHVQEAFTTESDALAMILAREGKAGFQSPRERIEELYQHDDYRHFGNNDEDRTPLCKINDQDPVDVDTGGDDGGLNVLQPASPVSCTLADGTTLFATGWRE